ncbi:MAG: phosphoribosylamine--glycine ligase [Polyangiales bacterium]
MKVLLIGSGGREHALALALAASPSCTSLLCAPGNPGIAEVARCVPLRVDDLDAIVDLARVERVGLVVVGPELPLVLGLVDRLEAVGVAAFGPTAAAARLEGSKGFTKDLCARAGIPTAAYARFRDLAAARAHLASVGAPIVVKADGLAAGKGVVVAASVAQAEEALAAIFAAPDASVVLESMLQGPELSLFALCDGERAVCFGTAMDYKRVRDGDEGPNTGGMGAISPHPLADTAMENDLLARFITPTLTEMRRMGAPFRGVLYLGVMLTTEGPMLLEYNARFGDPECQALLARFDGDLLGVLLAATRGALRVEDLRWRAGASACVVIAAHGYPGDVRAGDAIEGIDDACAQHACIRVLHAGTRRDGATLRTAGGRVLSVVATGADVTEASVRAKLGAAQLRIEGAHWRRDVGRV